MKTSGWKLTWLFWMDGSALPSLTSAQVWVPRMLAPAPPPITCVDTSSPQWPLCLSFTCVLIDLLLLARAPPFPKLVPAFYRVDAVASGLTMQSLGT